jgi:tRNA G37 N-methylase Trm5
MSHAPQRSSHPLVPPSSSLLPTTTRTTTPRLKMSPGSHDGGGKYDHQHHRKRQWLHPLRRLQPTTTIGQVVSSFTASSSSMAPLSSVRWASSNSAVEMESSNTTAMTSAATSTTATTTTSAAAATTSPELDPQENASRMDTNMAWLLEHWRDDARINPTLQFETWLVPSSSLHKLIKEPLLQPYLANHLSQQQQHQDETLILQHVHPRIKMIQDYNSTHKLLLRSPVTILPSSSSRTTPNLHPHHPVGKATTSTTTTTTTSSSTSITNVTSSKIENAEIQDFLQRHDVVEGPISNLQLSYRQLSLSYILSQLLASSSSLSSTSSLTTTTTPTTSIATPIVVVLTDLPTAYEQVGHIAHFNFKQQHLPYSRLIGQVLVEIHPTIEMVVHKVGQVSGPYRTYPLEILATKKKKYLQQVEPEQQQEQQQQQDDDNPNDDDDDKLSGKNDDSSKLSKMAGTQFSTETTLTEHSMSITLDIAKCYWCSRLSGERQVILEELTPHSLVADVFCGVGTLCLLAHRDKHCRIVANDWNPTAIHYFRHNIDQNAPKQQQQQDGSSSGASSNSSSTMDPSSFALSCGDSYEYLMDLGLGNVALPSAALSSSSSSVSSPVVSTKSKKWGMISRERRYSTNENDSEKKKTKKNSGVILPDHVIMNYPLEAPSFLGALRWWDARAIQQREDNQQALPRFHVYTFARADREEEEDNGTTQGGEDEDEINANLNQTLDSSSSHHKTTTTTTTTTQTTNSAPSLPPPLRRMEEDVAVDLIANALLAGPGDSPQMFRREELNQDYNCNVQARVIRDVAPGKVCVCVSFSLTSQLVRHMQGDFV